jgi:ComF family protein
VISFLYPSFCRFCGLHIKKDSIFCTSCDSKITPTPSITINLNKNFSCKIYAASDYKDPLKKLILRKNSSRFVFADRLASRQLGNIIYQKVVALESGWGSRFTFDLIIPVPLHWTRYAKRGFNQSHEMAKVLGKKLGIPVIRLLKRTRSTLFQSKLSFDLRQKNLQKVFVVRKKYINNLDNIIKHKRILFVDDLYTTGATIKNVIRPILRYNPGTISVFVACRVP